MQKKFDVFYEHAESAIFIEHWYNADKDSTWNETVRLLRILRVKFKFNVF